MKKRLSALLAALFLSLSGTVQACTGLSLKVISTAECVCAANLTQTPMQANRKLAAIIHRDCMRQTRKIKRAADFNPSPRSTVDNAQKPSAHLDILLHDPPIELMACATCVRS